MAEKSILDQSTKYKETVAIVSRLAAMRIALLYLYWGFDEPRENIEDLLKITVNIDVTVDGDGNDTIAKKEVEDFMRKGYETEINEFVSMVQKGP